MRKSDEELKSIIDESLESNKTISMVTYYLSDYGENLLKLISSSILTKFNRMDIMEICYTSAKELVINATKANVKRMLFKDMGLEISNPIEYEQGMKQFKDNLREDKILRFKDSFKKYNLPVTATFYYSPDVLNIKVKNNFPLLPVEESRIREKFRKSTTFASLLDFFMEYGDSTEGAGMGLTMVGILLDQSNIDKHAFSLYSSDKYNETVAKLELPLTNNYISKRKMFEKELIKTGVTSEELRKTFNYTFKDFKK